MSNDKVKTAPPKRERDGLQDTAVKASVDTNYTPSHQVFTWRDAPRVATLVWLATVYLATVVEVLR